MSLHSTTPPIDRFIIMMLVGDSFGHSFRKKLLKIFKITACLYENYRKINPLFGFNITHISSHSSSYSQLN